MSKIHPTEAPGGALTSPAPASEPVSGDPAGETLENKAAGPAAPVRKAVSIAIASLRHEMTAEEKAEEERRWKAIRSGVHPDTGKRLRFSDEKSLKPIEKFWVRTQRETKSMLYSNSLGSSDRMMERDRAFNMSIYGRPCPGTLQRAMRDYEIQRSTNPVALQPEIGKVLCAPQVQMDPSFGRVAQAPGIGMAEVDRQRFVDPLLDPAFVNRITGGVSSQLMDRAKGYEWPAIATSREQVNIAGTSRIVDLWRHTDHLRDSGAAMALARDADLMGSEAQRLISIYGPKIVEHRPFLIEHQTNTQLFASPLTAIALERSDLLARIVLPEDFAIGFDAYRGENFERIQSYAQATLTNLKEDFLTGKNPVFALEALSVARTYGIEVPEWVMEYLSEAADAVMEIRDEAENGKPIGKEAQRVGRALGFGRKRRGETGFFAGASALGRQREIYFEVVDWLEAERARAPSRKPKLTSAYTEIAKKLSRDPSTIRRAYTAMKVLIGTPEEYEN